MGPDYDFGEYAVMNVDIQKDFCPGGNLAVKDGDKVVSIMNHLNWVLRRHNGLVVFTRDWHPATTTHFKDFGGIWPVHCVQESEGGKFHPGLEVVEEKDLVLSKGMEMGEDGYSGFLARDEKGRCLDEILRERYIEKLIVGGLATDYCVKATVLDGLRLGYTVVVPAEGIKAVNLNRGDGVHAIREMRGHGALIMPARKLVDDLYDGRF